MKALAQHYFWLGMMDRVDSLVWSAKDRCLDPDDAVVAKGR